MYPQSTEKSLREELNGKFNRYHFVGIKNITKEPFIWSVALEENEILDMSPADNLNEQQMIQKGGSAFLPGDGATKRPGKLVEYTLQPGERKMVPGEAAYVLIPRLIHFALREKYGAGKSAIAKFAQPVAREEMLSQILVGPIVRNVAQVMNEVANQLQNSITDDGFLDVKADQPSQPTPKQGRTSGQKATQTA